MELSTAGGRARAHARELGGGVAVSRALECGLNTLFLSRGEHWKVPWALAPGRLSQLALVTLSKFGYGERSLSVCQSINQSVNQLLTLARSKVEEMGERGTGTP